MHRINAKLIAAGLLAAGLLLGTMALAFADDRNSAAPIGITALVVNPHR